MVKRAPYTSMVAQGWVSKPVNVSRQTWMVGPEYTWYMRCSCVKVSSESVVLVAMLVCVGVSATVVLLRRRLREGVSR